MDWTRGILSARHFRDDYHHFTFRLDNYRNLIEAHAQILPHCFNETIQHNAHLMQIIGRLTRELIDEIQRDIFQGLAVTPELVAVRYVHYYHLMETRDHVADFYFNDDQLRLDQYLIHFANDTNNHLFEVEDIMTRGQVPTEEDIKEIEDRIYLLALMVDRLAFETVGIHPVIHCCIQHIIPQLMF
ncbi:unnamed protein product [Caenorhabditis bovis]|uniref:Uncharacterized protein n=1 Tax=Caenorhabditis bovis TaxID=2654633 RepID=A0A8S1EIQ0_9PELO|nr:unnamed protein product [Caenorhabditis bovis]